jgi:hypothetical protein
MSFKKDVKEETLNNLERIKENISQDKGSFLHILYISKAEEEDSLGETCFGYSILETLSLKKLELFAKYLETAASNIRARIIEAKVKKSKKGKKKNND